MMREPAGDDRIPGQLAHVAAGELPHLNKHQSAGELLHLNKHQSAENKVEVKYFS